MKNVKTFALITSAAALMFAVTSCSSVKKGSPAEPPAAVTTSPVETTAEPASETATIAEPTEDMSIVWFADYDITPSEGGERSAALALFEDVYGGSIDYWRVLPGEKYTVLSELILGGDEVDMFPFEPEIFPSGVLNQQFAPLDPYFEDMGMEDGLWDDMSDVIDMFEYGGEHYVMPYNVTSPLLLTYSRSVMKEAELDDPYELYKKGEWNWNTFTDMMEKFTADNPSRTGICGDAGRAIIASTGKGIVGYDGGLLVNNLSSAEIEKAGQLMQDIVEKNLYRKGWFDSFPKDGSTLFMAMEDWTINFSNGRTQDMDIMVVPFPKSPDADKYYFSCSYDARMLLKNSSKGKAVATYLKCERLAATEESYRQAAKQAALVPETTLEGTPTAFITEEQYNAVTELLTSGNTAPVFDFGYGMGEKMYGMGDYSYNSRGAVNNLEASLLDGSSGLTEWSELCSSWKGIVDHEIKNYNS